MEDNPKFTINRMDNIITITINKPMAEDILEIMDDFTDLRPHEYALREQLRNITEGKPAKPTAKFSKTH